MLNDIYDVAVVGAGPAGAAAAIAVARHGVKVALFDKARFPRDKVCGDFLAPQALPLLEHLGCIEQVLAASHGVARGGDLFVNGEHIASTPFPASPSFPAFGVLVPRKHLDALLVERAIAEGAIPKLGCPVKKVDFVEGGVHLTTDEEGRRREYYARMVIGADGVNSLVSRTLGNSLKGQTTAVSVRAYYDDVVINGSKIQIYFDKEIFPGYGWVFADDTGMANVGIGYCYDRNFPMKPRLKAEFARFIARNLGGRLGGAAEPRGFGAGRACFSVLRRSVSERAILVGDAAHLTDPINGGGIHLAMDSGMRAGAAAAAACEADCFEEQFLALRAGAGAERTVLDRLTGSFILTLAVNPNLREIYLEAVKAIALLTKSSPELEALCSGIFTGVTPTSLALSPLTVLNTFPTSLDAWLSAARATIGATPAACAGSAIGALRTVLATAGRLVSSPARNAGWGMDLAGHAVALGSRVVREQVNEFMESLTNNRSAVTVSSAP